MFEFFGSTTTQHRLNASAVPDFGNTCLKLIPRLSVFHNPPNADATYHVFVLFGSMSMSTTRPVTSVGPMFLRVIAFSVSAVNRSEPPVCPSRLTARLITPATITAAARLIASILRSPQMARALWHLLRSGAILRAVVRGHARAGPRTRLAISSEVGQSEIAPVAPLSGRDTWLK